MIDQIIALLEEEYPDAACTLQYQKDYELLFAARLAAQCTDARVNIVTRSLFTQYPTLEAFAEAELTELEAAVHPCGFFRGKARDIKAAAERLLTVYGGKVPDTMEELLTLPGVGRKTANLMLGDWFGQPSVVVDTHCLRVTNRLGLVHDKEPEKIERVLRAVIPPEKQTAFCHHMVYHGRAVCSARAPQCSLCRLLPFCPEGQNKMAGKNYAGTQRQA